MRLTLARCLIRLAAGRAPADTREAMVREWDAELRCEADRDEAAPLLRLALGAFADARALRARRGQTTNRGWEAVMMGLNDVRLAGRSLWRSPGFTVVAVVTLGLGLGGSAAVFTLLDKVALSPLPYPEAERLVRLENQVPGVGPEERWAMSTAQWVFLTDESRTLEEVGLYRFSARVVQTPAGPTRAPGASVTASMMDLLGARARLGRVLAPADDTPASEPVVLVSSGFWERVLGSDPDVVGTTVALNGEPFTVVGVLEEGIEAPGWRAELQPDVWTTLRVDRSGRFFNSHVFPMIARLAPGADPSSVEAELVGLTARLPERFPDAYSQGFFDRYGFRTDVTPLREDIVGDMSDNLWLLFGAVGFVLLIACANVTNLFVVRMEGRRQEVAVRAAMGARGAVVARHLLAEGLTLGALGGALALALCGWGLPVLIALAPDDLPRVQGVTLGLPGVALTGALALLVGVVLAAYPALAFAMRGGADVARERSSAGPDRQRLRSTLVVTQVALALTLAVGAALLGESLRRLYAVDLGFEADGVIAMDVYMPHQRYADGASLWRFYDDFVDRVRALPDVVSAGLGEELPVEGGFGCTVQGFEDASIYDRVEAAGLTTCAGQTAVSPGYFEALGVPVLQGRVFEALDNDDPRRGSVVVSQAFADRFWPGEDPIGKGIAPSGRTVGAFHHVIGVVGDVPARSGEGQKPLSQIATAVYYPIVEHAEAVGRWNWWPGWITLAVETRIDDPTQIVGEVRRILASMDPEIPLVDARTMDSVVAEATTEITFVSLLLAITAGIAMLLAAVGLYGVVSYVVARRTREIGMRIAIGAAPGQVERMVVRSSMALTAAGLVIGTALAALTTRVMQGLLVGVEPTEPGAFVAAILALAGVGLLAGWLPARRASRLDPSVALRAD